MTGSIDQQTAKNIPVIDYEGSRYRVDFWVGQGRNYEDATERLALQRLMPGQGVRVIEVGAGFGRLADLYRGYDQIVLFDYSRTLLQDAARDWGQDQRFVFVAGNVYAMPFVAGIADTVVSVRVMHHLADVPAALAEVSRIMHRHSVAVLEYANKRNLKALLRWWGRRQRWSPLDREPVEFVRLNFDFHPAWMAEKVAGAGLTCHRRYAVSHFRLAPLKRLVAPERLARLDGWLFAQGGKVPLAPSVFLQVFAPAGGQRSEIDPTVVDLPLLLRCVQCQYEGLAWLDEDLIGCPGCGARYRRTAGVWDMKEPVS